MIADGGEEYLRLSLQTSGGVAVKNPVSITLEFSSERAFSSCLTRLPFPNDLQAYGLRVFSSMVSVCSLTVIADHSLPSAYIYTLLIIS